MLEILSSFLFGIFCYISVLSEYFTVQYLFFNNQKYIETCIYKYIYNMYIYFGQNKYVLFYSIRISYVFQGKLEM